MKTIKKMLEKAAIVLAVAVLLGASLGVQTAGAVSRGELYNKFFFNRPVEAPVLTVWTDTPEASYSYDQDEVELMSLNLRAPKGTEVRVDHIFLECMDLH